MKALTGIFLALHGLVHIWFVVLNHNLVPFEEKMGWTGKSWLLSNIVSSPTLKIAATVLFSISTILFIIGGILFILKYDSARIILILGSIISSITLIIFWDGSLNMIVQKGLIGLIINIGTILSLLFI